jgi:hypothetical protein
MSEYEFTKALRLLEGMGRLELECVVKKKNEN